MLRIDSGDVVVRRDRHRVAEIVAATLRELERSLNGHTVTSQVPGNLVIEADCELLRLALRQLLDNAVKYSPPGSTIEVRAGGNGTVNIGVRNSGPAIPEQEQRQIFERFYRGNEARRIPGTGMGLAIVRQIAEAHGGTLTVSSTPSSGTEFTLSLPSGESTS
jgi:signal transduction histidine kinase